MRDNGYETAADLLGAAIAAPSGDTIIPLLNFLLASVPDDLHRKLVRRRIRNWLRHPELSGLGHPLPDSVIHPVTRGWRASTTGSVCSRCGSPRGYHNIDGQHDGCDGWVEDK